MPELPPWMRRPEEPTPPEPTNPFADWQPPEQPWGTPGYEREPWEPPSFQWTEAPPPVYLPTVLRDQGPPQPSIQQALQTTQPTVAPPPVELGEDPATAVSPEVASTISRLRGDREEQQPKKYYTLDELQTIASEEEPITAPQPEQEAPELMTAGGGLFGLGEVFAQRRALPEEDRSLRNAYRNTLLARAQEAAGEGDQFKAVQNKTLAEAAEAGPWMLLGEQLDFLSNQAQRLAQRTLPQAEQPFSPWGFAEAAAESDEALQEYTEATRGERTRIPQWAREQYGESDQTEQAIAWAAMAWHSGPEAQRRIIERVMAGDDGYTAVDGWHVDLREPTQKDEWRLARYIESVRNREGDDAAEEALQQVHETGYIPGETELGEQLVGEIVMDPLDPFFEAPGFLVDTIKTAAKIDDLSRARKIWTSMGDEATEGLLAKSDELRRVVEEGELGKGWWRKFNPFELTPAAKQHRLAVKTHAVTSVLFGQVDNAESAVAVTKAAADNPGALSKLAGRVTKSTHYEDYVRPVMKKVAENVEKFPSVQADEFNPAKFRADLDSAILDAAKEIHKAEEGGKLAQFANGWRQLASEFYLRTPGYIVRNTVSDLVTMYQDGVRFGDSLDNAYAYIERIGAPTPRLAEKVVGGAEYLTGEGSKLPGVLGRISEVFGEVSRKGALGEARSLLGEEPRYVYTFSHNYQQAWDKAWNPTISDELAQQLGPELTDIVQAKLRGVVNGKELDALKGIVEYEDAGELLAVTRYMEDASDLPPGVMADLETALREEVESADDVGRVIDRFRDDIQEHVGRALSKDPQFPRGITEQLGDITDLSEEASQVRLIGQRAGMTDDQIDEAVQAVERRSVQRISQYNQAKQGFAQAATSIEDRDGARRLIQMVYNDIRRGKFDSRRARDAIRDEALDMLREGAPPEEVWPEYFSRVRKLVDERWTRANGALEWGTQALQDLARGTPLDEVMEGRRFTDEVDEAVDMYREMLQTIRRHAEDEERLGIAIEDFAPRLARNRTMLDKSQEFAWHALSQNPTPSSFDYINAAEEQVRELSRAAAYRADTLRAQYLADEIDPAEYMEQMDEVWGEFFLGATKRYQQGAYQALGGAQSQMPDFLTEAAERAGVELTDLAGLEQDEWRKLVDELDFLRDVRAREQGGYFQQIGSQAVEQMGYRHPNHVANALAQELDEYETGEAVQKALDEGELDLEHVWDALWEHQLKYPERIPGAEEVMGEGPSLYEQTVGTVNRLQREGKLSVDEAESFNFRAAAGDSDEVLSDLVEKGLIEEAPTLQRELELVEPGGVWILHRSGEFRRLPDEALYYNSIDRSIIESPRIPNAEFVLHRKWIESDEGLEVAPDLGWQVTEAKTGFHFADGDTAADARERAQRLIDNMDPELFQSTFKESLEKGRISPRWSPGTTEEAIEFRVPDRPTLPQIQPPLPRDEIWQWLVSAKNQADLLDSVPHALSDAHPAALSGEAMHKFSRMAELAGNASPPTHGGAAKFYGERAMRALDQIEEGVRGDLPTLGAVADRPVDNDTAKALRDYIDELKPTLGEQRVAVTDVAKQRADRTLLDYANRYRADELLSTGFTYHYWQTRSAKNWLQRMLRKPGILAKYLRYNETMEKINQREGRPERFTGSIPLPAKWLPDWMGDQLYVNPFRVAVPFTSLAYTNFNDIGESRNILDYMYRASRNMGLRLHAPLEVGLLKSGMVGQGQRAIGMLTPQGSVTRGATAMARAAGAEFIPPQGVNIEAPIHRALGTSPMEMWDPYRIADELEAHVQDNPDDVNAAAVAMILLRRVTDKEMTMNEAMGVQPGLLTSKRPGERKVPAVERLQEKLGLTDDEMRRAQEVFARGVNRGMVRRGVSQVGSFVGMPAQAYSRGEQEANRQLQEKFAQTYSPLTGLGSREELEAWRERNPDDFVSWMKGYFVPKAQGEFGADWEPAEIFAYQQYQTQSEQITQDTNQQVDEQIRQEPWNTKAPTEIKRQGYELKAQLRKQAFGEETGDEVYLSSTYGATPEEVAEIRRDDLLSQVSNNKPYPDDFLDPDGDVDWEAFKEAEQEYLENLPTNLMTNPTVMAMADEMGEGVVRDLLRNVTMDDLEEYWERNDTPMEALQRVWMDEVHGPAWDKYHEAVDGGMDKGEAYETYIEPVRGMDAENLIPEVRSEYGNRWSKEELRQAYEGVSFPSLEEASIRRKPEEEQTMARGKNEFWDFYNEQLPPGKLSRGIKNHPLIETILDRDTRGAASAEGYQMALRLMQDWVAENETEEWGSPEDWAKAREQQEQFDEWVQEKIPNIDTLLDEYYALPQSERGDFRDQNPEIDRYYDLRDRWGNSHPEFAYYYLGRSGGGSGEGTSAGGRSGGRRYYGGGGGGGGGGGVSIRSWEDFMMNANPQAIRELLRGQPGDALKELHSQIGWGSLERWAAFLLQLYRRQFEGTTRTPRVQYPHWLPGTLRD